MQTAAESDTGRERSTTVQALLERALADFPAPVWQAIETAYSEPHRHYHGLGHLNAMFAEYDRYESSLRFPRAVRWAIWMHDFHYDVDMARYPTNETRSATTLVTLWHQHAPHLAALREPLDTEGTIATLELAVALILCTKRHELATPFLQAHPQALADAQLFLDIDLSILAAPVDICDRYDENIRNEFAAVPEALFATERARALRHFLARETIFYSEAFARREAAARANLQRLIDKWERVAAQSTSG
jgi:predicted metal-dependent HD superfamily phosphohydrolase